MIAIGALLTSEAAAQERKRSTSLFMLCDQSSVKERHTGSSCKSGATCSRKEMKEPKELSHQIA